LVLVLFASLFVYTANNDDNLKTKHGKCLMSSNTKNGANDFLIRYLSYANSEYRKMNKTGKDDYTCLGELEKQLSVNESDPVFGIISFNNSQYVTIPKEYAVKLLSDSHASWLNKAENCSMEEILEASIEVTEGRDNLIEQDEDRIFCTSLEPVSIIKIIMGLATNNRLMVLVALCGDLCLVVVFLARNIYRRVFKGVPSSHKLAQMCKKILKEQAAAANAQGEAMAASGMQGQIISPDMPLEDLIAQVMNDLPDKERFQFLLRYRMKGAINELRSVNAVRFSEDHDESGKTFEVVSWVGRLDS